MAKYKKTYKKRSKSSRFFSKSSQALATATAALSLARQIKGLVNVEHHRHIISTTSSPTITSSGGISGLYGITQGVDKADRVGNSILAKYISANLSFINGATSVPTFIRLMYFIDRQQIGDTSPAVTDVLESASTTAPLNRLTVGRFQILLDKTINLQPNGVEGIQKKFYIRLNHHIRYNGATASDIQKGGIYRLLISNHTSNWPTFNGDEILMFIDN